MILIKSLFHFFVKKEVNKVIKKGKIPKSIDYISKGQSLRSSLMYQVASENFFFLSSFQKFIHCSVLIELIHNISIIHDDVIDGEKKRRNSDTLNEVVGLYRSVSIGDFFFLISFQNFFKKKIPSVVRDEIIKKLKILLKGELEQDEVLGEMSKIPSKKKLIEVVKKKTGSLFSLSTTIPYLLKKESKINFIEECGFFYGIVYQILDDILDIQKDISFLNNNFFFRHWTLPILIFQKKYKEKFLKTIKERKENKKEIIPLKIRQEIAKECFSELVKILNSLKKKAINEKNKKLLLSILKNLNTILIKKGMSECCFEIRN